MPIFEKNKRRIYFAHIPKTAGTTVYYAFAHAGWRIGNIRKSDNPKSTYQMMKAEFGSDIFIDDFNECSHIFPLQHVPHRIWKKFGSFDESFAILRDPLERFKSELKYRYKIKSANQDFEVFAQAQINQIKRRPWIFYRGFAGHLLPQHYFLASETKLFLMESDWIEEIAIHFDLKIEFNDLRKNTSDEKLDINLKATEKLLLRFIYYKDYKLIKDVKKARRT